MPDDQATFFATLIDEWVRAGIADAVVCPGNRSSLLAALLHLDGRIKIHSMVDERSASFFALGIGIATGHPALLWCTSGTATAELRAAVIESHYAKVPLLIATADRPPELHHVRDWQTVDQSRAYDGLTRWSFDPGVAVSEMRNRWRSIGARSVIETCANAMGPGPVHLNLPIREPWATAKTSLPSGRPDFAPWHVARGAEPTSDLDFDWQSLVSKRGVIVAGTDAGDAKAIHASADALGWPVLADLRSGARICSGANVSAFDVLLRSSGFCDAHQPDVIVHLGEPVLSKAANEWIADSNVRLIAVKRALSWSGTDFAAHELIACEPDAFIGRMADLSHDASADASWLRSWQSADRTAERIISQVMESSLALTEPWMARRIVELLAERDRSRLFVATSMPVRDTESFGPALPKNARLSVHANRGASGMDGLVATAAGISSATKDRVTMLTGDLSFLYDLNSLWVLNGAAEMPDLTIVVMDNEGGGIFRTLAQLESLDRTAFEKLVITPHHVDISAVISAFGIECVRVDTKEGLISELRRQNVKAGVSAIYVHTECAQNNAVRAAIYREVDQAFARENLLKDP